MTVLTSIKMPLVDFKTVHLLSDQICGALYCGCTLLTLPADSPHRANFDAAFFQKSMIQQFLLIGECVRHLQRELKLLDIRQPQNGKEIKAAFLAKMEEHGYYVPALESYAAEFDSFAKASKKKPAQDKVSKAA